MFKQLGSRLIFVYTLTTGVILTIIVIMAFFITWGQQRETNEKLFLNNFNVISGKFQVDNSISSLWIAEQEEKNNIIITMEDNGVLLQYMRRKEAENEERKWLVDQLRKCAQEDNINTQNRPVSVRELRSDIYKFRYEGSEYYGQIYMFMMDKGYRTLLLLQEFSVAENAMGQRIVLYFILDFIGIAGLYGISCLFVTASLKPVEESRRRQTEFVAAASHELRSPLSVIMVNLSAIKKIPEKTQDGCKQIEKEAKRMQRLLEDLLFLASKDAGNWSLQIKKTEVETLLIEVYEKYESICDSKEIRLKVDLPEDEIAMIESDKERMYQIFAVLIENAIRFSRAGGDIVLRGRQGGKGKNKLVFLEVEDHGSGIVKEDQEKVFERFYQEDKARTDKSHFGLGLSVAKELCELQKGQITCRETKGGGATFTITFLAII